MKKLINLTAILLILAGGLASCKDNEEVLTDLKDTTWKLVGIVDVATGNLKILEVTKEHGTAPIFTFGNDSPLFSCTEYGLSSFSAISSKNYYGGCYEIDYKKNTIQITSFGGTRVGYVDDEYLFQDALASMQGSRTTSFLLQGNELRLYYDNKKNYLLFKQIQP